MSISQERIRKLTERIEKARKTTAHENAVGQWIAGFFEAGVTSCLQQIMNSLQEYDLLPVNQT